MVVRAFANGGPVRVTSAPLGPRPVSSSVCTVVRAEGLWRHKWADRATFEAIEQSVGPQAPLFVAVDGTVLETSRGNVFLLMADGGLRTAPLSDDVLPGVTRRAVLDLALDRGRPVRLDAFTVADLRAATACFWTSSLSGLVPITDVDGLAVGQAPELIAELDDSLGFWRRL
jgi:para-aminobenzoate synthetase/4-amino-4-deoxychorismate lyase